MKDKDRVRIDLTERSIEMITRLVAPKEKITGRHVQEALELLEEPEPTQAEATSVDVSFMQSEIDQLYRDLTTELNKLGGEQAKGIKLVSDHLGRIAVSLDTMRLMLNTFGEELAGADTEELFKRLDAQMEKVLIPIARKTDGRIVSPTKGDDDTRGSQRDEHEETQDRDDADFEMNGHDLVQNGKEPEGKQTREMGRGL